MRLCQFPGCDRLASSNYSKHCNHHRSRARRNGDPAQKGVTKADLKPFEDMVTRRIALNPANATWAKMDARWAALVNEAQARIASHQGGMAMSLPLLQAAEEIVRLSNDIEARKIVVTVSAMALMRSLSPHTFRSDTAFNAQLVRRVRALTPSSTTAYRDAKTGKARRVYHQVSPRTTTALSEWLWQALGILGPRLAQLEEAEQRAKAEDRAEMNDAIMSLK